MAARKTLGEKLAMLLKSTKKKQAHVAENLDMPVSQLNRFLCGRSDLSSANLTAVLKEVGIDLEEIISKKIGNQVEPDSEIASKSDCLLFLFESLDELGKQTTLAQLAWASQLSGTQLPVKVKEVLDREVRLI